MYIRALSRCPLCSLMSRLPRHQAPCCRGYLKSGDEIKDAKAAKNDVRDDDHSKRDKEDVAAKSDEVVGPEAADKD